MSKLPEPRRYRAFRSGIVYAVAAFLAAQLVERFSAALRLDENSADLIIIALALGLVPTVIITWMLSAAPEGAARRSKHALSMSERLRAVPDEQADADPDEYQRS